MVPADSQQISRARCYSGIFYESQDVFVYGIITLYDRPFQTTSTNNLVSYSRLIRQNQERRPHNTAYTTPAGYHMYTV